MKRQVFLLVALLASTSLIGCGGKKKSSTQPSTSDTSSSQPLSSSSSSSSSSIAPTVTGISLNADNVRRDYSYGDALNLAGLVVNADYSDNTSVPVTNYTTNPANGTALNTHGQQDVVVSYETFTASFSINVEAVATDITLNVDNVKMDYFIGNALNLNGLKVSLNFSDGTSREVDDYTTNPANGTALNTAGSQTVVVSYGNYTKQFSVNITDGSTPIVLPESNTNIDPVNYDKDYYPEEILLNRRVVSLLVNETFTLEGLEQYKYSGKNLAFSSNDESIATVTEAGLITGKASGRTTIVVSDKNNPDLKTEVPVIVSPTVDQTAAAALQERFKAVDESSLSTIHNDEMYIKTVYKNGKIHSFIREDQRLEASYPEGYFRILETDAEIKADEGATDFTNYDWIFYTNEYYQTYMYHQTGDVKNFIRVQTQDYVGKKERYEVLMLILDNLFTSGSGIFEQTFRYGVMSNFLTKYGIMDGSDSSIEDLVVASRGEGCAMVSFAFTDTDSADLDDENRYGIPYGTEIELHQVMRFAVENDKVISCAIEQTQDYEIAGDQYREVLTIDNTFTDITPDDLFMPNRKDYTEVDSLFDL